MVLERKARTARSSVAGPSGPAEGSRRAIISWPTPTQALWQRRGSIRRSHAQSLCMSRRPGLFRPGGNALPLHLARGWRCSSRLGIASACTAAAEQAGRKLTPAGFCDGAAKAGSVGQLYGERSWCWNRTRGSVAIRVGARSSTGFEIDSEWAASEAVLAGSAAANLLASQTSAQTCCRPVRFSRAMVCRVRLPVFEATPGDPACRLGPGQNPPSASHRSMYSVGFVARVCVSASRQPPPALQTR